MTYFFKNRDDRTISITSGLTLIILIVLSGFSVYSIMQPHTKAMVTSGLRAALENQVKLIETQIAHSIANTRAASTRIFLTQSLEKANSDEFKDEGLTGLIKSAEKILSTHFSGIHIYGPEGDPILSSGLHSSRPALMVELDTGPDIRTVL